MKKPKVSSAVFRTSIILDDDLLAFDPDFQTVSTAMIELAEKFIETVRPNVLAAGIHVLQVCRPVRLLCASELYSYTELYDAELELVLEGPRHPVGQLIMADEKYLLLKDGIQLVCNQA